ncbi:MAG: endonuclease III [Phycisphaerae bacterium]|nr:endonuclease III [Phycisphaerae bacterium]
MAKPQPARLETGESPAQRRRRAGKIVAQLHALYPEADCALRHCDPFQLLVATILSAQSTDETVNKVTPALFAAYATAPDLAAASLADIERIIRPTGFFRQKAKNIKAAAQRIVESFGGEVPSDMDALISLPGVARKTANVVLGTAFGRNAGVVVDTHIGRLALRLALAPSARDSKDAVKIERDLMAVVPQSEWTFVGHALIWHGRRVCSARKPNCPGCALSRWCPSAELTSDSPAPAVRLKKTSRKPRSTSESAVR